MLQRLSRNLVPAALLLAGAPTVLAQSLFEDPVEISHSLAESGREFTTVDIDHDGDLDLLVAYAPSAGLRILLGNGDGTFAEPYDVSTGPGRILRLASADFNLDGRIDLALAMVTPNGMGRLLWLENTGSSLPLLRAIDNSAGFTQELIAADVDGDGSPDLVLRLESAEVASYLNPGGTFSNSPATVTAIVAADIECADLNGDGRSDVMFAIRTQSNPSPQYEWKVVLGAPLGAFQAEMDLLPPGTGNVVALNPSDLDSDGDQDLALFLTGSAELKILEATGPLTFAPALVLGIQDLQGQFRPDLVDVDGDGTQDLLYQAIDPLVPTDELRWRRGLGGFQFAAAEIALAGPIITSNAPVDICLADLTGDGVPEALIRRWLLGGLMVFAPSSVGMGPRFSDGVSPTATPSGLGRYRFADVDSDGDKDILGEDRFSGALFWFRNLGNLCFEDSSPLATGLLGQALIAADDFDQDGILDLLYARGDSPVPGVSVEVSIRYGSGSFGFAPAEVIGLIGGDVVIQSASDADGDGDLDVLILDRLGSLSNVIILRNDSGSFVQQTSLSALPSGSRFLFTDANNDSMTDVIEGSSAGASVRLSTGNLSFAPPATFQGAVPFLFLRDAHDVDGDGHSDILALDSGVFWVWAKGDGQGGFLPFTALVGVRVGFGLHAGDFNGDGLRDAVVSGVPSTGSPVIVYLGQPDGTYVGTEVIYLNTALQITSVDLQDLDGDGDLDGLMDGRGVLFVTRGNETQDAGAPPAGSCVNVAENSLGCVGSLRAFGTPGVNSTDLELFASALPSNQFGMFVGSTDLTLGTQPANSSGFLCLTGAIGRYDSPGQIGSTGPGGTLRLPLDPGALETSMGQVPAVAGASWGFQAWHRDLTAQGVPTSNFTGAVVITFQP